MISITYLFEQEKRQAAESSAVSRRNWAKQRMVEAKAAAASGRIDQKTLQQRLKYWQKALAGSAGSPAEAQAGTAANAHELKTMGTFF